MQRWIYIESAAEQPELFPYLFAVYVLRWIYIESATEQSELVPYLFAVYVQRWIYIESAAEQPELVPNLFAVYVQRWICPVVDWSGLLLCLCLQYLSDSGCTDQRGPSAHCVQEQHRRHLRRSASRSRWLCHGQSRRCRIMVSVSNSTADRLSGWV